MLVYGSLKVWPIQMPQPSLAVLNDPYGNLSPFTMFWALLGSNLVFQAACGAAEILIGILLLVRRTALFGALCAAAFMGNIVLFDLCFDVPVKLYSLSLLLVAILLIAPETKPLLGFFWQRTPSAPAPFWLPGEQQSPRLTLILEISIVALLGISALTSHHHQFAVEQAHRSNPSPLMGRWHIDRVTWPDGSLHPLLSGDALPMNDLYLEPSGRVNLRAGDDTLWSGGDYDTSTLSMAPDRNHLLHYRVQLPDSTHTVLLPQSAADPQVSLTRVPLPAHYPLYERGFHWINEWGFER
jgi:hypothetical protein